MSAPETVFAAVITAASAAGLILTSHVLEGWDRVRWQMIRFYTSLSNAAVFLTHALLLIPGPAREVLRSPRGRYVTTLCILVTFLVYFFVLTRFGRIDDKTLKALGVRRLSNFIVHYLVPGLTVLEWLTAADKRGLGLTDTLVWLLVPLCYLLLCVWRAAAGAVIGSTGRRWPYGFMDLDDLGPVKWARNLLFTLAGFFALGLLLLGVSALYQ